MEARKVFVIWKHPLFYESVRLLLVHPEVEWLGATSDFRAEREKITSLRPDTILIEEAGVGALAEVMEILESSSWSVRVIGLSLNTNQMSVYHREQRLVGKADDLLRLILDESIQGG